MQACRARALRSIVVAVAVIGVAACSSAPRRAERAPLAHDGADAVPRIEPIKSGGANKPYQVLGRDYVPLTRDVPFRERGLASWYGGRFDGQPTASGEIYDMQAMTAAHPTLPIPSYARIVNPANGRAVVVRINDRGPFHAGRIVDLSYAAARRLDLLRGVAPVELERITFDEIRSGSWRGGAAVVAAAPPPAPGAPGAATARGDGDDLVAPAAPTGLGAAMPRAEPPTRAERGWWLQLGAFRDPAGAATFERRVGSDLEALAPRLATFAEASLFRVQAGPYASRAEAESAAARVRDALGVVPLLVDRR